MLNLVTAIPSVRPEDVRLTLDEIAREGARRMLIEALQAEVSDYIDKFKDLRDEAGKRLVVRHGKAQLRILTLGAGAVELQAPRVKDHRPDEKFSSRILPAYIRKSPKVENLLPILYLKGLSSSDFRSALTEFFGDISIPELSGIEVCRTLRGHPATAAIPIIMLTAHGAPESRVHGLDTGADDYIAKPFHGGELLARIRARVRQVQARDPSAAEFGIGNLQVNRELREALISDRKVRLTRIECDLLDYFISRLNRVVERRQLLGDLWPDSVVSERTVDTHMANLRKKIAGFDHCLDTLHGSGYILRTPGSE